MIENVVALDGALNDPEFLASIVLAIQEGSLALYERSGWVGFHWHVLSKDYGGQPALLTIAYTDGRLPERQARVAELAKQNAAVGVITVGMVTDGTEEALVVWVQQTVLPPYKVAWVCFPSLKEWQSFTPTGPAVEWEGLITL